MAAWFRSNTMNSRSIDSSTTPRSARPYIPSDVNGNVEAMMIDMMINEIQTHISRVEDEHVGFGGSTLQRFVQFQHKFTKKLNANCV
jgi:hypothetical protein